MLVGMHALGHAHAWDALIWEAHAPRCATACSQCAPQGVLPGVLLQSKRLVLLFQLIIPFESQEKKT